jgi:hypothetical protein
MADAASDAAANCSVAVLQQPIAAVADWFHHEAYVSST